jgi:hypothetical protein
MFLVVGYSPNSKGSNGLIFMLFLMRMHFVVGPSIFIGYTISLLVYRRVYICLLAWLEHTSYLTNATK